jgi:uncharacterized delta-60 repeat protein
MNKTQLMKKLIIPTFCLFVLCTVPSFAQYGILDTGFDSDGRVTTFVGNSSQGGRDLVIQPDGKILLAGTSYTDVILLNATICRYLDNGHLDSSFGTNGVVIHDLDYTENTGEALAIQDDGKILVGGYQYNLAATSSDFVVTRLFSDGSIDSSFGMLGTATIDFNTFDQLSDMIIQPDGKIVVTGTTRTGTYRDIGIARLDANGTIDSTFDLDGKQVYSLNPEHDYAKEIDLQNDGKILIGGYANIGSNYDFLILRYHPNGMLDSTFHQDGMVNIGFGIGLDHCLALKIQPDGNILAGGITVTTQGMLSLARFKPNGDLDSTFGTDGNVLTPVGANTSIIESIEIQPDHKIIVAGFSYDGVDDNFALARYHPDGTLDNSFSGDGLVTTDFGGQEDQAFSIAIQPDLKIVAGGHAYNASTQWDFALTRYTSGLNVGVVDFDWDHSHVLAYPNPIQEEMTLTYTLKNTETISIDLFDMNGTYLDHILDNQQQDAGDHTVTIQFAPNMSAGMYYLVISNGKNKYSIKLVK